MINENLKRVGTGQAKTVRQMLFPVFLMLVFAMSFGPARTQAQMIGNVVAEVPFQFHVGNTTLPAGKYLIHQIDDSDLMVMQISSVDGKVSALFNVEPTEAKSAPEKTELIFNKYRDRYFLSEMFDEENADGNKLVTSRDEKLASKESGAEVAHVAAHHANQEGN